MNSVNQCPPPATKRVQILDLGDDLLEHIVGLIGGSYPARNTNSGNNFQWNKSRQLLGLGQTCKTFFAATKKHRDEMRRFHSEGLAYNINSDNMDVPAKNEDERNLRLRIGGDGSALQQAKRSMQASNYLKLQASLPKNRLWERAGLRLASLAVKDYSWVSERAINLSLTSAAVSTIGLSLLPPAYVAAAAIYGSDFSACDSFYGRLLVLTLAANGVTGLAALCGKLLNRAAIDWALKAAASTEQDSGLAMTVSRAHLEQIQKHLQDVDDQLTKKYPFNSPLVAWVDPRSAEKAMGKIRSYWQHYGIECAGSILDKLQGGTEWAG